MPRQSRPGPAKSPKPIKELVERVGIEVRRLGAQNVMTRQAVSERFGLHTTDLECLDLIFMRGQASAGELARATGLTSGAMTALIDRLEKAGYVIRVADPNDRRRHHIRIRPEAIEPIKAVYQPMQSETFKLWSTFTARELRVIVNFLSRSTDLAIACVERISSETAPGPVKRNRPRTSRKKDSGTASPT
jgi:DNA-binding MarR family transcriptional regulator